MIKIILTSVVNFQNQRFAVSENTVFGLNDVLAHQSFSYFNIIKVTCATSN